MKPNYSLSFLILPNGFDPDSFVRKNGRNNFESLLNQKIDIGNFVFENNLQELQSEQPEERAGFEKKIMDLCQIIQDSTVKKHYISFFKNKIINEELVSSFLYTKNIPDPDILIRTGGEKRLSNFLLWQLSYAELFFTDKNWPYFNFLDLKKIVTTFSSIKRKFGGLNE